LNKDIDERDETTTEITTMHPKILPQPKKVPLRRETRVVTPHKFSIPPSMRKPKDG